MPAPAAPSWPQGAAQLPGTSRNPSNKEVGSSNISPSSACSAISRVNCWPGHPGHVRRPHQRPEAPANPAAPRRSLDLAATSCARSRQPISPQLLPRRLTVTLRRVYVLFVLEDRVPRHAVSRMTAHPDSTSTVRRTNLLIDEDANRYRFQSRNRSAGWPRRRQVLASPG